MMRSSSLLSLVILAAIGATSVAGPAKPTAAEAKQAAVAWRAELEEIANEDKAAPTLTATPFYGSYYSEEAESEAKVCALAGTDAKTTLDALRCVGEHIESFDNADSFKTWSKKLARHSSLANFEKKRLAQLAKTATLVFNDSCAGQGDETLIAVVKDADGTLKVAAAFVFSYFCGE